MNFSKHGYKFVKWHYRKIKEIPEDWDLIPLGKLCGVRKNGEITSNLYVGLENIGQGNNVLESREDISKFSSTTNVFLKDDVLYGKLRPLLNKVWLAEESGFCSTDILPLVVNDKIINKTLLLILTYHDFFWYAVGTSSGTKMPRTNWSDMKNFLVVLPPLLEQQKITSILSNIDLLIQQTKQIIEQTQILKKGLIQKLLTKGIGHKKLKEIQFGAHFIREKIPESWKIDTVKNSSEKLVVGFVGTCEPYYVDDDGIPLLRTTNIKEGEFDLSNLKYVTREFHENNIKSQVKEGDILVSRHGINGEACLVRNIVEANCLNIVIIRPKKDLFLPEFFELAFNSNIIRRQIQRTTAGSVQDVVNTSEIGKALIIIPDLIEQNKIISIFNNIRLQIQNKQECKSKLENLKKGLMQKLLTGQIRVKI